MEAYAQQLSYASETYFIWKHSSVGRASALQAGGHRFEPCTPHHTSAYSISNRPILLFWGIFVTKKSNPKYQKLIPIHHSPDEQSLFAWVFVLGSFCFRRHICRLFLLNFGAENNKLLVSIKFLHIYSHFCFFDMPLILNIENVAIFRKKITENFVTIKQPKT